MNKKEILENTQELVYELGDVSHKLVIGLERLTTISGGSPLLTPEEYTLLKGKFNGKKNSRRFSGCTDIDNEIGKNLESIGKHITNTSILISALLHESESTRREQSKNIYDLKRQLENYQIEMCYLERELARYRER